ncbi:malonate decarboxylase holo-[acyl-carrier-protein] synthase [Rhodovastum atsumiense]|nr:malonate decarboxylase holo-[acyl-carrier-protein] synthase [Rhodovastum atsumiense]
MFERRHVLAFPTLAALPALLPELIAALPPVMRHRDIESQVTRLFLTGLVPGIVARPTRPCGACQGQLGFAFPVRVGEQRVRAAVLVSPRQVRSILDPWQVMREALAQSGPPHPALPQIAGLARHCGLPVGLIGSAALQAVTRLGGYLRPDSDLDIVVAATQPQGLETFWEGIQAISSQNECKIDVEIDVNQRYGVKLEEYCSRNISVLVKTIHNVFVTDKSALFNNHVDREEDRVSSWQFPGRCAPTTFQPTEQ